MLNLNVDQLVKLYKSGKTTKQIGGIFGVDKATIASRLKRVGIDLQSERYTRVSRTFARRREAAHADLIALYTAGKSTRELSEMLGVPQDTIARQLRKHGIDPKLRQYLDRIPGGNLLQLPEAEILKLFQDGMSTQALAKMFGCSRRAIDKRLQDVGVESRGGKEAQSIRMKRLTKEQRQKLTEAAHAAVKGKRYSFKELCRRASERQSSVDLNRLNRRELLFYSLAAQEGITLTPQYAIGPYNADFRIHGLSITVEIYSHGGSGHNTVPKKHKRLKYILRRGYSVITIISVAQFGITEACIQKVQSFIKEIGRNKTKFGKEYVILGNGKFPTRLRPYSEDVPGIRRPHRRS